MEVLGADATTIGRVKDVSSNYLLIDRPLRRDIYVPFDAIQTTYDSRVVLAIPSDQVDDMNWPRPSLLSFLEE
jgi:hypothetical protein